MSLQKAANHRRRRTGARKCPRCGADVLRAIDDRDTPREFEAQATLEGRWYVGVEELATLEGGWRSSTRRPTYRARLATAEERTRALPLFDDDRLPTRLWRPHDCPVPSFRRPRGVQS